MLIVHVNIAIKYPTLDSLMSSNTKNAQTFVGATK